MRKVKFIALLLSVVVLLSGCGGRVDEIQSDQKTNTERKIMFVTDTIAEKRSFEIWKLLQSAAEGRAAQVTLAEVSAQSDKTAATLNQASEGLYDIVILDRLSEETAEEWLQRNAGYYPEVQYLCLDAQEAPAQQFDNVLYIVWDDSSAYYLLGAAAAAGSKNASLAFVAQAAGIRSELDFLAFYEGALLVDPAVRAQYIVAGGAVSNEEILNLAQKAKLTGTDLFCLQNDDYLTVLQQDAEAYPEEWENVYFLTGEIPLSPQTRHTAQNLLLDIQYPTEQLLTVLFERCCSEEAGNGIIEMSLREGKLLLSYGDMYSLLLDEREKSVCATLKKEIMESGYFTASDASMGQEERQLRIQQAAGSK